MATNNKDFRIKNGLIVDGANATVNGSSVLTTASSINALNDVTITTPSSGQVLKWNGTAWINDTDATGAGGGNVFETISANGTSVVADSSTDTLTITPGSGMSIVGNATSDTVTFSVDYAEKIYYLVRNNTGSTISKGTLVSASGAEPSGRIDVAPHSTTGTQDSELRVMGMATANISNGVNGEVISFGTLVGIDTRGDTASAIAVGDETWAEGDILYAHPTVSGKLTNVRPQHDLAVAFITVRHASTGQIAVRIVPGNHHLEWLHDVAIDGTPADNELLAYNSNTATWINQTAEEAGVANLSGATFTGNVAGTNISLSGNVNATTVNATTFTGTAAFANTAFSVAISNVSSMGTNVSTFLTTPNSINFLNTITDETGTGNVVFSTSPVLTTPNIGAAIGTSLNVTANLNASTLRLTSTDDVTTSSTTHAFQIGADNSTNLRIDINEIQGLNNGAGSPLFINNEGGNVSFGTTGGSNVTVNGNVTATSFIGNTNAATITGTVGEGSTSTAASGVGYMGIPRSAAATTGSYTLAIGDAGEHIYTTTTRTVTIPGNTTGTGPVAFPIGTTVVFINDTGVTLTLQMQASTTDTCVLSGIGTSMTGGSGTRSLAAHGMATLVKVTSTRWYISGNGLT